MVESIYIKNKNNFLEKHNLNNLNLGTTEGQIAIISFRLGYLTNHLLNNPKDLHSRRGLNVLSNKRKKLISYLKKSSFDSYKNIISILNIRG